MKRELLWEQWDHARRSCPTAGSQFTRLTKYTGWLGLMLVAITMVSMLTGCQGAGSTADSVVAYVSVDQQHAEPVIHAFEEKTGIAVKAVYDVEAAKTTGMVNRLLAEKDNPQADVFWSGEFVQTILLRDEGVLEPYRPQTADELPAGLSDSDYFWTGFGGRARVFIINTDQVAESDYPTRLADYLDERWPADRIALAMPLFGTTNTHACALYAALGPDDARQFFADVKQRGVRVESGNSTVRDLVADGTLLWGLTDTDDAAGAMERGAPVAVVFPEQGEGELGTLIIPNSVALVAGGGNPDAARQLIDFLTGEEAERMLVESGWYHIPSRAGEVTPLHIEAAGIKPMDVGPDEIYAQMERAKQELTELFVQ